MRFLKNLIIPFILIFALSTIIFSSLDYDVKDHANRNRHNRPAKGKLTRLRTGLPGFTYYKDEANCVWRVAKFDWYHPSDDRNYVNVKLVRPDPDHPGAEFETVLHVERKGRTDSQVKKADVLEGTQVKEGITQQTYNYGIGLAHKKLVLVYRVDSKEQVPSCRSQVL